MSPQQPPTAPPEQPTQPRYDDTTLVWREVKYYETMLQPTIHGLYADFRETFDGWTRERFQNVHPDALRALKWSLRRGGVYTGSIRIKAADALAHLANIPCVEAGVWPRPPYWDRGEFMEMRFNPKSEAHDRQMILKQLPKHQQPQAAAKQILPPEQPAATPNQQGPPVKGPVRFQLPDEEASSTPTQTPPNQGPPMAAQSVRPGTPVPAPATPLRGALRKPLPDGRPASAPPQQPSRGTPVQATPPNPFTPAGPSQVGPPQAQQPTEDYYRRLCSQLDHIRAAQAAQTPPSGIRPPSALKNNNQTPHQSAATQPANPFSVTQPAGQRPGMNPNGQGPTGQPGPGQGRVYKRKGNGRRDDGDGDEDMDDYEQ